MLTSKQRAQLKGMASTMDTIVHIGKGGITENVIIQVKDALKARELIKGKVLENCELTPREVLSELASACKAEEVQAIGTKIVLYKRNEQEPKIVLIKSKKK